MRQFKLGDKVEIVLVPNLDTPRNLVGRIGTLTRVPSKDLQKMCAWDVTIQYNGSTVKISFYMNELKLASIFDLTDFELVTTVWPK